jgi:hypothetical protein
VFEKFLSQYFQGRDKFGGLIIDGKTTLKCTFMKCNMRIRTLQKVWDKVHCGLM